MSVTGSMETQKQKLRTTFSGIFTHNWSHGTVLISVGRLFCLSTQLPARTNRHAWAAQQQLHNMAMICMI